MTVFSIIVKMEQNNELQNLINKVSLFLLQSHMSCTWGGKYSWNQWGI